MRAEDVEVCARIVAGDPLWQRYGVTLQRARRALRAALAPLRQGQRGAREAGEVVVATRRGRPVGFILFRLDGTFHHSGYIRWLAVAPEAQRQGVGRRLVRHAEDRVFRHGPNVFLTVSDFNTGASAFYRRLGYRQVGTIPDYVVPGIAERLFRKTLGPIEGPTGGKAGAHQRGGTREDPGEDGQAVARRRSEQRRRRRQQ